MAEKDKSSNSNSLFDSMASGLLGGLGSGALGAIGSIFSNRAQKKENERNRQFTERMYDKQYDNSIKVWNMEKDYDKPINQLARMKEAGLNPDLMYNGAGVSPTPNLKAAVAGSASSAGLPGYGGIAESFNQGRLVDSQIQLNEANAKKAGSETNLNLIDAITRGDFNKIQISGMEAVNALTDEQKNLCKGQLSQINKNMEVADKEMQEIDARIANLDADTTYKVLHNMFASQEFEANIAATWASVKEMEASAFKSYEDVKIAYKSLAIQQMLANSTVKLNDAQIENLGFKNREIQSVIDGNNISNLRNGIQLNLDRKWSDIERELGSKQVLSQIYVNNTRAIRNAIPIPLM